MHRSNCWAICGLLVLVLPAVGQERKPEPVVQGHSDDVRSVALSGDGSLALTGSYDRTAILWDAKSGEKLRTFSGHKDNVTSVALSGDASLALTGSASGTPILWGVPILAGAMNKELSE